MTKTMVIPKENELEPLASAMNRSAERLQTLWFTFLAVTIYFAVSAFTTTHRMLLLEEGQTLPIINVKLPLLPFYVVAPFFYVVIHAYVLIMLVLLARTAKTFEDALRFSTLATEADRERYRMRIENAIFLQIIVGAKRERAGANGMILRAIALISVAIVPLFVLLLFQLMFLPYHNEFITWWHRFLIVVDIGLLWTLWPAYRLEWGERIVPRLRPFWRLLVKGTASAAVLVFSFLLATFPGETAHANMLAATVDVGLFGSIKPDLPKRKYQSRGAFPNRLWLPGESFADEEKLKRLVADNSTDYKTRRGHSIDLAGRDLAGANLDSTDLRGANFENANLSRSILDHALLAGVSFEGAKLKGASLYHAWLQDTTSSNGLRAALITRQTELQGASFDSARAQGVSFGWANLSGAAFSAASLEGASFERATLNGAIFVGAKLQGASFVKSKLNAASFYSATLIGASFSDASLQETSFEEARAQGVDFTFANLAGTFFKSAHIQGANFRFAKLDAVVLTGANLSRTHGYPASKKDIDIDDIRFDCPFACSYEQADFDTWQEEVLQTITEERTRRKAARNLKVLDPQNQHEPDEHLSSDFLAGAQKQEVASAAPKAMAQIRMEEVLCAKADAPFVAMAVIKSGQLNDERFRVNVLVEKLRTAATKATNDCPGAFGLTKDDFSYVH